MADVTAPQFQQVVNDAAEWANGDENTTVTMQSGQQARSPAKVIKDIQNQADDALVEINKSRGFRRVGTFASGFTYELANDVGIDASGDAWVYADIDALPSVVTAGTVPSGPEYTAVALSDAAAVYYSENDNVDFALRSRAGYYTSSEAQSITLDTEQHVRLTDFGNTLYRVITGETPNKLNILPAINGKQLKIPSENFIYDIDPITFNTPANLPANCTISTDVVGESVLTFSKENENIEGVKLRDITILQPNDPNMSGGTGNNHFCLALSGAVNSFVSDLFFEDVDLCVKFEYGSSSLSDRACKNITSSGFVGVGVRGMGLQVFGLQNSSSTGHSFKGNNGVGGRAQYHGLRVTAFDFAPNFSNKLSVIAENFTTGVSLQQYSYANNITVNAKNCEIACLVHGDAESVASGAESHDNTIKVTAESCDRVIYSGSRENTFIVKASNCLNGIIDDDSANSWLGQGNTYIGEITNTTGRLIEIKGDEAKLNLKLKGVGAATTHGAIVSGDGCSGILNISNCNTPLSLSGGDSNLTVTVKNCVNTSVVSGSGNFLNIKTDGNLTVIGDNNVIKGVIAGTITDNGSGNDFSGALPKVSKRLFSQSTNGSGQLVITHNLGAQNAVCVSIYGAFFTSLVSSNDNEFTVNVFNSSDGTMAANKSDLVVEYNVCGTI